MVYGRPQVRAAALRRPRHLSPCVPLVCRQSTLLEPQPAKSDVERARCGSSRRSSATPLEGSARSASRCCSSRARRSRRGCSAGERRLGGPAAAAGRRSPPAAPTGEVARGESERRVSSADAPSAWRPRHSGAGRRPGFRRFLWRLCAFWGLSVACVRVGAFLGVQSVAECLEGACYASDAFETYTQHGTVDGCEHTDGPFSDDPDICSACGPMSCR